MTITQIVSLLVVAGVGAYFYLPGIKWPAAKPSNVRQIQAVLAIRDSSPSPEVHKACTALLQALIQ